MKSQYLRQAKVSRAFFIISLHYAQFFANSTLTKNSFSVCTSLQRCSLNILYFVVLSSAFIVTFTLRRHCFYHASPSITLELTIRSHCLHTCENSFLLSVYFQNSRRRTVVENTCCTAYHTAWRKENYAHYH